MSKVYFKIFPEVNRQLIYWKNKAEEIPNQELRKQALASINTKKFHCQGGAVYSLLAGKRWRDSIRFIIAYQTISDYLDNLCDRSSSLDPIDFQLLHQSMYDALSPKQKVKNYYRLRQEQEDGGYLIELVQTCQNYLKTLPELEVIQPYLLRLEEFYADLQVHKHVTDEERLPRLEGWFQDKGRDWSNLAWYEFSASSGSTLGIFCLVSYAMDGKTSPELAKAVFEGYFPYVQGLHILLDYFIDQQEDKKEGDLNFCFYYPSLDQMKNRLLYFIRQSNQHVQQLPHKHFHEMVHQGLVGLYLADPKVKVIERGQNVTRALLHASGWSAKFFHLNVKTYNMLFK
ncbi:tetraprenyl-beta-curcumene synthase family protein [Aquibacillus sp. 3ASR75-11]|uniref:Tetraprenyl-beta-curcumene synthase family protein n=2 Tax=Terrihalobacillus insolitus TaxID=2950438 RepID=A0A9X4ALX0_9BACI|nr:tetraprenyl-beta-curcumene synthase family protein [Terrihalobacillus insolitus]MDC3412417.1 tetraprenyl-beta-curcumene synthase family protein [Terrihalobacillus insolitus]MDC3422890.1 tetraprenyl-beta-curcumene synthase family protein [Terrihalobacillus insolitus]